MAINREDFTIITPREAALYAITIAIDEAVMDKVLTQEQADALTNRADELNYALVSGKMLAKNKQTGKYEIEKGPYEADEADEDDVMEIGG